MKNQSLTTGSVAKHVRDLALPASIGLFFQTMYNVVDSFYAGQISTMALASLGLSFPVFLLIIATSGGLSRGSSALIANAIGAKDSHKQQRYTSQCFSLGLCVSVGLTLAGLLIAGPLFQLLGASGEYLEIALSYIRPIFIGSVFIVVTSLSNAVLVANGDSRTFGKVLVVGFFLNLILDPWFLYGGFGLPPLGIAGIAWATVVIQMLGSAYMFSTVLNRGLLEIDSWRDILPELKVYREIAIQALPASFNIMSVALGFFVTTYFLKFYGEATVAAYGVTTRIEQISLLPTFGLSAAIMALVGQNNGAGNHDRIRETMKVCNLVGLALVITSSIATFCFAQQLMSIFTNDPEVIQIGVTCLHIFAPIQWAYVMTSTHLAMLQAITRPMYGFYESVIRKIILPMPLLWIVVAVYQLSVDWVWYANATTTVLMTIITICYGQSVLRKLTQTTNH